MTTPAINLNENTTAAYQGRRIRRNASGVIIQDIPYSGQGVSTWQYRVRPESVSNPVRPDGSRPVRAWDHRWGLFNNLPRRAVWKGPYAGGTVEYAIVDWNENLVNWTDVYTQMGLTWLNGNNVSSFPPSVIAQATTEALNKALDTRAELGTTLGEMHKTVGFVAELCNGVASTVHRLADFRRKALAPRKRRGKERRLLSKSESRRLTTKLLHRGRSEIRAKHESIAAYRRRLSVEKSILQKWLGYQFGVKPLVMDLQGAAEAFSYMAFEAELPMRLRVKNGATRSWDKKYARSGVFPIGGGFTFETTLRSVASCHYSFVFDMLPSSKRTLQMLGLTNPASVAWELVQFSWLLDYAVGIGDWIKSMTKLDGVKFVEGTRSLICRVTTVVNGLLRGTGGLKFSGSAPTCNLACGRFRREVLTALPLPAMMPSMKKKLSIPKLANALSALALATQTSGSLRI